MSTFDSNTIFIGQFQYAIGLLIFRN